jgi:hypothetical protein
VAITFDPAKRERTLAERGLDFADAAEALDGPKFQFVNDRRDYGGSDGCGGLDATWRGLPHHLSAEGE